MEKYSDWSREQLLERIQQLEKGEQAPDRLAVADATTNAEGDGAASTSGSTDTAGKGKKKKAKKAQRPFDMSKYRQRHVAMRVAYLGWRYAGFAAQNDEALLPTIEGQLFLALEHCRLVQDRESCDYSRCGRTDRGVSGLGQVIMLNVRSKTAGDAPLIDAADELAYVDLLNKVLPEDIRILAWAPVADKLNARFDCRSRTYRYLFRADDLDIDLMRNAAARFVGPHDFRNFCKLDPSKNITNYERTILACDITALEGNMMQMQLQGTAFLWHQVRCMMSVLFLVGKRLEAPSIVSDLLDPTKYPARPEYPMASDLPLILYDCEFQDIHWHASQDTAARLFTHFDQLSYAQDIRAHSCHLYHERVKASHPNVDPKQIDPRPVVVLGGGATTTVHQYKPLAQRPLCDSDDMKKEKYNKKRKRKEMSQ
ncbi:pseudouridine synthase [Gongronella butleri]|nr:pseudouridine synthase [Gongronella butleri]